MCRLRGVFLWLVQFRFVLKGSKLSSRLQTFSGKFALPPGKVTGFVLCPLSCSRWAQQSTTPCGPCTVAFEPDKVSNAGILLKVLSRKLQGKRTCVRRYCATVFRFQAGHNTVYRVKSSVSTSLLTFRARSRRRIFSLSVLMLKVALMPTEVRAYCKLPSSGPFLSVSTGKR